MWDTHPVYITIQIKRLCRTDNALLRTCSSTPPAKMPPPRHSNNYSVVNSKCPCGVKNCTDSQESLRLVPNSPVSNARGARGPSIFVPPPPSPPFLPLSPPRDRSLQATLPHQSTPRRPLPPPNPLVISVPQTSTDLYVAMLHLYGQYKSHRNPDDENNVDMSTDGEDMTFHTFPVESDTGSSRRSRTAKTEKAFFKEEDDWISLPDTLPKTNGNPYGPSTFK